MNKLSKIFSRSAFIALLVVLLVSCGETEDRLSNLPGATGALHEIVTVSELLDFEESSPGKALSAFFEDDMTGLANSEKWFDLITVNSSEFNNLFKRCDKIMILNMNDLTVKTANYHVSYNNWANGQMVIKLNAANMDDLLALIQAKSEEIMNRFHDFDMKKQATNNWKDKNDNIVQMLKEKYGCRIPIPKEYYLAVNQDNFTWIRFETQSTSQGILIHSEPYTEDSSFTFDYIISKRDTLTKKYIPGPSDGTYMMVNPIYPKRQKVLEIDGAYTVETRGLWKTFEEFYGGSYISYTIYNEPRKEILTIEGFVHAPNKEKRIYMLDLEGILKAMKLEE